MSRVRFEEALARGIKAEQMLADLFAQITGLSILHVEAKAGTAWRAERIAR